jgi:DNA transposition AAA+ family ATPase
MIEYYKEILRPCILSAIDNIRLSNNEARKKYFQNYLNQLLNARRKILFNKKEKLPPEYFEEIKKIKPNQQLDLF